MHSAGVSTHHAYILCSCAQKEILAHVHSSRTLSPTLTHTCKYTHLAQFNGHVGPIHCNRVRQQSPFATGSAWCGGLAINVTSRCQRTCLHTCVYVKHECACMRVACTSIDSAVLCPCHSHANVMMCALQCTKYGAVCSVCSCACMTCVRSHLYRTHPCAHVCT